MCAAHIPTYTAMHIYSVLSECICLHNSYDRYTLQYMLGKNNTKAEIGSRRPHEIGNPISVRKCILEIWTRISINTGRTGFKTISICLTPSAPLELVILIYDNLCGANLSATNPRKFDFGVRFGMRLFTFVLPITKIYILEMVWYLYVFDISFSILSL